MSTFVLVHGAWFGGWCWNKVSQFLQHKGHNVITPDLPGYGEDSTSIQDINLPLYINHIERIVINQSENVYLLGHSMSGMIISAVAEKNPDKVKALIYLCACLPKNGDSLVSAASNHPQKLTLEFSDDKLTFKLKDEYVIDALFNKCDAKEIELAKTLMKPQPTSIFGYNINLSEEKFGQVAKFYIECTDDHAVSIDLQRDLQKNHNLNKVFSIDSGHCPFFSAPDLLGQTLHEIFIMRESS